MSKPRHPLVKLKKTSVILLTLLFLWIVFLTLCTAYCSKHRDMEGRDRDAVKELIPSNSRFIHHP